MIPAGERAASWRVSSHSEAGNCAEVAGWRVSSASAFNGNCAELGATARGVAVRDSKDRGGPVLLFGPAAWAAFTRDPGAAVAITPGLP